MDNKTKLEISAKEYISKYNYLLNEFIDKYEADETDFIDREIEYFEYTLMDIEHSESSHDGYSLTGNKNFLMAYELVSKIGWDSFYYSTNAKIKFLVSKIDNTQYREIKSKYIDKKTKKPFQWLPIGILFAQGLISKKAHSFLYKKQSFESIAKLSLKLSDELNLNTDSIRPYLVDNLSETKGQKSFYTKDRMNKIIAYCKDNNLNITKEFLEIYENLTS